MFLTLRGKLWLDQGGLFVIANIRGGGELGPDWNVRKTQRRHTYEDFIAVAEDLIRRKVTSPRHLGIWGPPTVDYWPHWSTSQSGIWS